MTDVGVWLKITSLITVWWIYHYNNFYPLRTSSRGLIMFAVNGTSGVQTSADGELI